jgi:hypothetical protein
MNKKAKNIEVGAGCWACKFHITHISTNSNAKILEYQDLAKQNCNKSKEDVEVLCLIAQEIGKTLMKSYSLNHINYMESATDQVSK